MMVASSNYYDGFMRNETIHVKLLWPMCCTRPLVFPMAPYYYHYKSAMSEVFKFYNCHKCITDMYLLFLKPVCVQLTCCACCCALQEQRMHALKARVGASEQALAALEQTATEQMKGLTQQSSNALDRLQRQLGQAHSHLEQLHAFIKVLY